MNRTLIEGSSNVKAIGYDPQAEVLEIEFIVKDGKPPSIYRCQPVKPEVYAEMLAPGASAGKLYHQRVKCDPAIVVTRIEEAAAS